jgi:putative ABC transport system permease protein
MKLYLVFAWRNLWRNKRRTWITVLSVVFAVVLALFLESMDRGSQETMVNNLVRFSTGYVNIQDPLFQEEPFIDNTILWEEEQETHLLENDKIDYLVPRLQSVMLGASSDKSSVVYVTGIHPEYEHRFTEIKDRLVEGEFFNEQDMQVVIGAGLANFLEIGINDTLILLGQGFFGATAAGKFAVVGLLKHPVPDLNETLVYLKVEDAQWLFSADDRLTSVVPVPVRNRQYTQLVNELKQDEMLKEFSVYTWEELQPELLRTVKFDQAGTLIFLLILYVVIAFGIFGTILTMTLEREKEFGVLISVGMHRWKLGLVILLETLFINFLGVILGLIISVPVVMYFYFNPINLGSDLESLVAEYGLEPVLKFSLDPTIFYNQGIIIFCISMAIVAYPVARVLFLNILDVSKK